jgi:5,6,7,8-tetrahydromethanopterin hydro-lyase
MASARLLAVDHPESAVQADTILFNKVTIKGAKQASQMFGPAPDGGGPRGVDSVPRVIPKGQGQRLVRSWSECSFTWQAEEQQKIYQFNYEDHEAVPSNGRSGLPTVDSVLSGAKSRPAPVLGVDGV